MIESWFFVVWTMGIFVLGSIPMGDLVARTQGVDIRSLGTGNPGAANIYREIGPVSGVIVFLLDVAVGAISTVPLLFWGFHSTFRLTATLTVIGVHFFPLLWRRRGGTGLAVALGTILGLLPLSVLFSAPIGVAWLLMTRSPSHAGGIVFFVTVVAGGFLHRDLVAMLAVTIAGFTILAKSLMQYRNL